MDLVALVGRCETTHQGERLGCLQAVGGWDHGCGAFVDGVDDLGVVDPSEVDGGDREVSVSELALDDQQRDSLT